MPDELTPLVHRLRSGIEREETSRRLDGLLRPRLLRFYLAMGFSRTEGEDLVQDALIRVFQHVQSLREEARFLPWLFTVARNLGRTAMRGRRDLALAPEAAAGLADSAREQGVEARAARERLQHVERHLDELPQQQRRCLLLVVRDELSYAEVGDLLGLSALTVRNHLARARSSLRRALADEERQR